MEMSVIRSLHLSCPELPGAKRFELLAAGLAEFADNID